MSHRRALPRQVGMRNSGYLPARPRRPGGRNYYAWWQEGSAREWLLERDAIHYHTPDDIRQLLRSFADLSGETRGVAQGMGITLGPSDTPACRRALEGLCAELSQLGVTFPGTGPSVR